MLDKLDAFGRRFVEHDDKLVRCQCLCSSRRAVQGMMGRSARGAPDGLDAHVPKPYIYFAMGFAVLVEWLNLLMRRRAALHRVPGAGEW